MKYVFGPVSSKRLGQSLGVDLLPPKSCTWNCVYCQLGKTKRFVTERSEFFPKEEILHEIVEAIANSPSIDWITFVGSGETTLYKGIGWIIHELKQRTGIPVAVITNGSLLYLPEVRHELLEADAVLPSLNAGSEELHDRIGRSAEGFGFRRHVDGLRQFRREYSGKLWVEVMLIAGLNDSDEALEDLAATLSDIRPDTVHLVVPNRPAPESFVGMPDEAGIEKAVFILSKAAPVVHPVKGSMNLKGASDLLEAVTAIAVRHPVQERELEGALLECFPGDPVAVRQAIDAMLASGRFEKLLQGSELYWVFKPA
ncbi:MAG: radical SAM protein [Chlorobiaceae bacterium]|nr:radical SAM protein [Chlorobiaceae bacterium]